MGVSHARNCAAATWAGRASCGAARSSGRAAAETRIRWGAGARGRYACAGSLLTSHCSGCSGMTLRSVCLLGQGACARGCDEACDQESVFEVHGMLFRCVEEQTLSARGGSYCAVWPGMPRAGLGQRTTTATTTVAIKAFISGSVSERWGETEPRHKMAWSLQPPSDCSDNGI